MSTLKPNHVELDWYMGPAPWDGDPRKMWHYNCPLRLNFEKANPDKNGQDGEVLFVDNGWICQCGATAPSRAA